ncbi:hypothetical protein [Paraburkholderia sp. BCC1885]|uniref:hypothetical protein n=1 Tax=Paraburkholderia sp. BCC1885 TaxID=2562669 RepID=UPI0011837839|nr:hypothetical protein [Paraburkholderia sp. BCC1885]
MPIVVGLAVLAALIYGAVWSFDALWAHFGLGVAVGAAVLAAAGVAAAVVYWLRRRREVAANIHDGDWTHELKADWGFVRLAAGKRLCTVDLHGVHGDYIFADIQGAEVERIDGGFQLALKVRDAKRSLWNLPMRNEGEAKRWGRVFGLAIEQRL